VPYGAVVSALWSLMVLLPAAPEGVISRLPCGVPGPQPTLVPRRDEGAPE
jgi:hypothetical protein